MENTLDGLCYALDFGVAHVEFDVRLAACGTPMVYHDEFITNAHGARQYLSDHRASEFTTLGGRFAHIPSLDVLLRAASHHKNSTTKLLIDIKDFGLEAGIHALVKQYRLENRVIYVSWVPEVLYSLSEIAPNIPKCFSHWCQPTHALIRQFHTVYTSKTGIIPSSDVKSIIGTRSGWEVLAPLQGEMLSILQAANGGICVPRDMITEELSRYYQDKGLFVSTFAYLHLKGLLADANKFNINLYFIDNKKIFEELS